MAANGQLLIKKVSSETNEKLGYWCQIRNKLTGETFLSQSAGRIKLTEHQGGVPPTISHITDTLSVEMGRPVDLSCVGQGYPPPVYTWKSDVDGEIISRESNFKVEDTSTAGTFKYSCTVKNKFGSDESRSTVVIRGKKSAERRKLYFIHCIGFLANDFFT